MGNIKDVLYIPDYLAVMCIYNENRNLSVNELHYTYKISYSSLHDMKKIFVEKGWVTIEKQNKKHIVKITPEGEGLANTIYDLMKRLGIDKDEFFSLKLGKKKKVINNEEKNESRNKEESASKTEDTSKAETGNEYKSIESPATGVIETTIRETEAIDRSLEQASGVSGELLGDKEVIT